MSTGSRHLLFLLASLAALMGSIDNTIVAVALPQLTTALDAPLSWAGWTITAYQLMQIVMLPVVGKLSDSFGRKPVFVFCAATFTVASLLCGLAPNIGLLVAFRALQAIGGGGLMPSGVGIISDLYRERRAQAIGLFTSLFPLGNIIGPNLGGLILQNWSWRELFFINVPIGVVVVAGVLALLPDTRAASPARRPHVDLPGLALYGLAIVALVYPMTVVAGDPTEGSNPAIWATIGASAVLLVVFVRHIRRTPDPVMDYDLVARNPFLATNLYNLLFGAASLGFSSFLPYYAVARYGMTPFESGAVLTPRVMLAVSASAVASMYVIRLGYRLPMVVGMALIAVGMLLLAQGWETIQIGGLSLHGFWLMAVVLLVNGSGMGIVTPAASNAGLDLSPRNAGSLIATRNIFRFTGGVVSITAIVLALSFFPDRAQGLSAVFTVLAGVMLLALPLTFLIPDAARERYLASRQEVTASPTSA